MTINQYRIIIEVFRSFGIPITGKWKQKDFIADLKLNQIYVQAILYEIELRLGIYLEEDIIEKCCCPLGMVIAFKGNKNIMVV